MFKGHWDARGGFFLPLAKRSKRQSHVFGPQSHPPSPSIADRERESALAWHFYRQGGWEPTANVSQAYFLYFAAFFASPNLTPIEFPQQRGEAELTWIPIIGVAVLRLRSKQRTAKKIMVRAIFLPTRAGQSAILFAARNNFNRHFSTVSTVSGFFERSPQRRFCISPNQEDKARRRTV